MICQQMHDRIKFTLLFDIDGLGYRVTLLD